MGCGRSLTRTGGSNAPPWPEHDPDAVPLAMPVRSEIVIEVTTDMDEELARLKREQRVERAMNIYTATP